MNFFVGLSDSYKNIEKLWTIIASFLVILFVGAIITEVIRKKQPTTYLKISPYIFTVLGIYPMCPGKAEFTVVKPIVASAELFIHGKWVDILAPQAGKDKVSYGALIAKE